MKNEITISKEKNLGIQGISLIALVITIIIILILAGVTISLTTDSTGLFSKTNEAVTGWNIAVERDKSALTDYLTYLEIEKYRAQNIPVYTWETTIKEEDLPSDKTNVKFSESNLGINGERSIELYFSYSGTSLAFGDEVDIIAILHGYENYVYTVQWQSSQDDVTFSDIENANELAYHFTITPDNYLNYWRLLVTIFANNVSNS